MRVQTEAVGSNPTGSFSHSQHQPTARSPRRCPVRRHRQAVWRSAVTTVSLFPLTFFPSAARKCWSARPNGAFPPTCGARTGRCPWVVAFQRRPVIGWPDGLRPGTAGRRNSNRSSRGCLGRGVTKFGVDGRSGLVPDPGGGLVRRGWRRCAWENCFRGGETVGRHDDRRPRSVPNATVSRDCRSVGAVRLRSDALPQRHATTR